MEVPQARLFLHLCKNKLIEGEIKANKMKLIQAWIEIHNDELMADWELALKGENIYKIDPLK